MVQAGRRRRRIHVASAAFRRTVGGLLCPRAARLASPVASRAAGPAGAGWLLSRGDAAQRRCLRSRPVAGRRLSRLAVLPDARSGLRSMADAGTTPFDKRPVAGPGHSGTAGRPGRKSRREQHFRCRAGQLARRLARSARTAPVRGGVLAGPGRPPGLPPGLLRAVRLLRVHPIRGGVPAGASGRRDAAARVVLRRADARRTTQARPAARRAATRASVRGCIPALPVSGPVPDGGDQRCADRRALRMDHRPGRGASSRSRTAHSSGRSDQIPACAARIAIPGHQTRAHALRADARRLARRDARLAAHHLRPGSIPRLDVWLPADTARRRHTVQHLDLPAAGGDRDQGHTRRRARAARALPHVAS